MKKIKSEKVKKKKTRLIKERISKKDKSLFTIIKEI